MSLWQGGKVALVGVVVGALAALGLMTYIQTLLFNGDRLDVTAFAGMSALMVGVALLASYVPARCSGDGVQNLDADERIERKRLATETATD